MIFRDAVGSRRIVRGPIDRSEPALTRDTSLQLRTDLVSGAFLQRIGATGTEQNHRQQG